MPAFASYLIPTVEALRQAGTGEDGDLPVAAWEVLSMLVDPRGERGRRHELATVLVVALAAVLAGSEVVGRDRWLGRRSTLLGAAPGRCAA